MRRRRTPWARPEDYIPVPRRPYRDSAIFYGILAVCVVAVAFATGGELPRALIFGGAFFLVATAWSWWRFRQRLDEQRAEAAAKGGESTLGAESPKSPGSAAEIERSDQ